MKGKSNLKFLIFIHYLELWIVWMKKSNLFRKRKLKNQMRKLINKRMIHALEIRKGKVKMKISVI
jgi:hypothetical protein